MMRPTGTIRPYRPAGRRAFTLVELLAVVAVILLMLAIMMPTLGRMGPVMDQLRCLTNQRNLAIGLRGYVMDNQGRVMPVEHTGHEYWFHRIAKYIGEARYRWDAAGHRDGVMQVMHCPRSRPKIPNRFEFGSALEDWRYQFGTGSYGMNLWFNPHGLFYGDPAVGPIDNFFATFHDAGRPATTPLFCDANWVGSWPDAQDRAPGNRQLGYRAHAHGYFMGRMCIDRHEGTNSISFHDGSARAVPLARMWQLTWHRHYQVPPPVVLP